MAPFSKPVIPAQPSDAVYGFDRLALFKSFTRESYFQAFGVQAPAWNPAKPKKTWFDSTAAVITGPTANYLIATAAGEFVTIELSIADAMSVNIPGLIDYPVYSVAPTSATVGGQPFNADLICEKADAMALAAELGGGSIFQSGISAFGVQWGSETRRPWGFMFKGGIQELGPLLKAKYANGVGYPISWNLDGPEPVAVFPPALPDGIHTGVPQPGTDVPMPVRPLDTKMEKVFQTLIGAEVMRTDTAVETTGEGFTQADRNTLQAVYAMLKNAGLSSGA